MRRYEYTQTDKHIKSKASLTAFVCLICCVFQERRILEETVTPLNPTGLLNQQTGTTSSAPENNETKGGNLPLLQNGQRISTGNEDQHSSKLHFFQGEIYDTYMQEVSTCFSAAHSVQPCIRLCGKSLFVMYFCRFCM